MPSHRRVYTAVIAGVVVALAAYGFFAQFEHAHWFPSTLAVLLNQYEFAAFGGLAFFVAMRVLIVLRRFDKKKKVRPAAKAPGEVAAQPEPVGIPPQPRERSPKSGDPFARGVDE